MLYAHVKFSELSEWPWGQDMSERGHVVRPSSKTDDSRGLSTDVTGYVCLGQTSQDSISRMGTVTLRLHVTAVSQT